VTLGIARRDAERLNEAYRKYITTGMPFVTVKVAQSLDGKIATRKGDSRWISSPKARQFGHYLRAMNDAVLVGAGTLIHDDPLLTARGAHGTTIQTRQPLRIVLDPGLCSTPARRIFSHPSPVLIATTDKASPQKKIYLSKRFSFVEVRSFGARVVNLRALMRYVASQGIISLLVEGGGSTIAQFFKDGLVDKAVFVMAPKIIGGKEAITAVEGKGVAYVKDALSGITRSMRVCGDEIIWEVEF
jgi:diaminohydroxyphosphoribosylaminopyrimidine deaminase/5-amino-6-(5-phosphoribosylamino)uracil reductase